MESRYINRKVMCFTTKKTNKKHSKINFQSFRRGLRAKDLSESTFARKNSRKSTRIEVNSNFIPIELIFSSDQFY
jgi:succinate dehydrogenase flavin-adding protein (antitoxin of CptAB toxin-antitoxin module)